MKSSKKILIGTNNQNKLRQFRKIFDDLKINAEIFSLSDLNIFDDVEEDGKDILEIAKKKADYYGKKSNMLTISDDLGLFVDVLNGEPGAHAKRWHAGTEKDRCNKLIERLGNFPENERVAQYVGVVAIYNPENQKIWTYQGELDGVISDIFKGNLGFGYDPIFQLKDGRHFAELTEEERNQLSHRGKAIREYFGKK